MPFNKKEKLLINRELRRNDNLITKRFSTIKKKKSGKYVEVWKNKKTGEKEEHPANVGRLKFKLKVARSR